MKKINYLITLILGILLFQTTIVLKAELYKTIENYTDQPSIINTLMNEETDATILNKDGNSPLHLAINKFINDSGWSRESWLEVITKIVNLKKNGIDIKAKKNLRHKAIGNNIEIGDTPILVAAKKHYRDGVVDLFNTLMKGQPNLEITDSTGNTPLIYLLRNYAYKDSFDLRDTWLPLIKETLKQKKSGINIPAGSSLKSDLGTEIIKKGQTPLIIAIENSMKSKDIVDAFIQADVDASITDANGNSPLVYAVFNYFKSDYSNKSHWLKITEKILRAKNTDLQATTKTEFKRFDFTLEKDTNLIKKIIEKENTDLFKLFLQHGLTYTQETANKLPYKLKIIYEKHQKKLKDKQEEADKQKQLDLQRQKEEVDSKKKEKEEQAAEEKRREDKAKQKQNDEERAKQAELDRKQRELEQKEEQQRIEQKLKDQADKERLHQQQEEGRQHLLKAQEKLQQEADRLREEKKQQQLLDEAKIKQREREEKKQPLQELMQAITDHDYQKASRALKHLTAKDLNSVPENYQITPLYKVYEQLRDKNENTQNQSINWSIAFRLLHAGAHRRYEFASSKAPSLLESWMPSKIRDKIEKELKKPELAYQIERYEPGQKASKQNAISTLQQTLSALKTKLSSLSEELEDLQ